MTSKNLFSEEKNKDGYTASYVLCGTLGGHWAGDVMSVWTQDVFDDIVLMLKKQVTRGYNVVADGWTGASNPHPPPQPTPDIQTYTNCHLR